MEFHVLGPLRVMRDGVEVPITAAKQRVLLAVLAAHAGTAVSADELIDRIWDGDPPQGARDTLRAYVMRLRKAIGDPAPVERVPNGYRLTGATTDLQQFQDLVARAGQEEPAPAAALLGRALELWRGEPAEGMRPEEARSLVERRLDAAGQLVDLRLGLGEHDEVVGELRDLVEHHPLREGFWAQLMLALYRGGRQAEALSAYQRVTEVLATELGVTPGEQLRDLYTAILRHDQALRTPTRPGPNTLVTGVSDFTGRARELRQLLEHSAHATVVISAIDGMAGVGKTTLALHAAHELVSRYPDGQLFIDLRGHSEQQPPVEPAAALDTLLRALGTAGNEIPDQLEHRAALWRSELAGKRALVVLDNAASAAQVQPLLPGSPGCFTLITSRRRLTELDSATLSIDVLDREDALDLLIGIVGANRVAGEFDVAWQLIDLCGGLPLAIRIAGARLRSRPGWTIEHLVGRLLVQHRTLTELTVGNRSVAGAFALSYQQLDPEQQRGFRLLGLLPGRTVDRHAAAALSAMPVEVADQLLEDLVDVHLLQQPTPGRYRFHDLVREHAHAIALAAEPEAQRRSALGRLLDYYLRTAWTAAQRMAPGRRQLDLDRLPDPMPAPAIENQAQAFAWADAEHDNLLGAITYAAENGWPEHAWKLPHTLWSFYHLRGHVRDWIATHEQALAAARRLGDDWAEAETHKNLAIALYQAGHLVAPLEHQLRALELYRSSGDRWGEGVMLSNVGNIYTRRGEHSQAMDYFQQSLAIRREVGDQRGVGNTLGNIGIIHLGLHHYAEALAIHRQALAYYEQLGDRWAAIETIGNIGIACSGLGQYDEALVNYRHALDLIGEIGDHPAYGAVLTSTGETLVAMGRPGEALATYEQALARNLNDRFVVAIAHDGLAQLIQDTDPARARRHWTQALALYEELGAPQAAEIRERLSPRGR